MNLTLKQKFAALGVVPLLSWSRNIGQGVKVYSAR